MLIGYLVFIMCLICYFLDLTSTWLLVWGSAPVILTIRSKGSRIICRWRLSVLPVCSRPIRTAQPASPHSAPLLCLSLLHEHVCVCVFPMSLSSPFSSPSSLPPSLPLVLGLWLSNFLVLYDTNMFVWWCSIQMKNWVQRIYSNLDVPHDFPGQAAPASWQSNTENLLQIPTSGLA